ncbi:MAG: hypothetical protein IT323_07340, partial [Anaerolineae bacterium]|nr:hypothetical protein [Anaerolineae bacterium]
IMEAHEWQGGILGLGGKKVQRIAWEGPYTAVRAVTREPLGDGVEPGETITLQLAEPALAGAVEVRVLGLPVALAEARLRNAVISPPAQSRWPVQVEASGTDERSA